MSATDENRIEIWKTIIDVQKHFNELEMRIRSVAVTVLAAFLAAAGFTMKENIHVSLWIGQVSLTPLVLMGGALCWLAFYGMDRFWYHRLLIGASKQGLTAEDALATNYPEVRLIKAIGDESPIHLGGWKIHSSRKIDIFYGLVAGILLLAAAVSAGQPTPPAAARVPAGAMPASDNSASPIPATSRQEPAINSTESARPK
jgi:hypothetical protein